MCIFFRDKYYLLQTEMGHVKEKIKRCARSFDLPRSALSLYTKIQKNIPWPVCNLKSCQIYTKTVIALTKLCNRLNLVYMRVLSFLFFCFVFHTKFCPYGILATKNEAIVCVSSEN